MIFLLPSPGHSQIQTNIEGEIINVNHDLQVVFIDIGDRYLKQGDVLEIQTAPGSVVYMQTLDASKVLSKLGLGSIVLTHFNAIASDINKIQIGNRAVKIDFTLPEKKYPGRLYDRPSSDVDENFDQGRGELKPGSEKAGLDGSIQEKDPAGLEVENDTSYTQECSEKIRQLENTILVLKQKLELIKERIDENIKFRELEEY